MGNKSAYYAKRLHESLAGFGTNDRALIRIVSTRCEIDMVDIKNAYISLYGKSLETDIQVRFYFVLYLLIIFLKSQIIAIYIYIFFVTASNINTYV